MMIPKKKTEEKEGANKYLTKANDGEEVTS